MLQKTKILQNRIAPNGPCLRRCPRPTGPRAMWVERCAVAARNPEPDKYIVIKMPSDQILRAKRGQVVRCSLKCFTERKRADGRRPGAAMEKQSTLLSISFYLHQFFKHNF